MNSQQKFYLVVLCILVILGSISYLGMNYKKEQLSQEVTPIIPVVSSEHTNSTGVLITIPGSNQSGSLSQSSTGSTAKFKKPNTEWKTRTLSGITYVFGEGNPKEVALDANEVKEMSQKCLNNTLNSEFCDPNIGFKYVTPEIEKRILLALSDPNWEKIANECERNIRSIETPDTTLNAQENPIYPYYDRVFSSGFLDLNNFISIDPRTGLKKLDTGLTIGLSNFLMLSMLDGQVETKNPYGDCVDNYAKGIIQNFIVATNLYIAPLESPQ